MASSLFCQAVEFSDEQLVDLVKQTFVKVKQAKTQPSCVQAIKDTMGQLNDAQKTRAMALRMFDFDQSKDHRRLGANVDEIVTYMFDYDPMLIKDPTELKKMMANEKDARKFYLLSWIAMKLAIKQKTDFISLTAPMLFRHEPMAKQAEGTEYYDASLEDASHTAYGLIANYLRILNADFVPTFENDFTPTNERIPYEVRIPILVKWLKANWPGCENLGIPESKAAAIQKEQTSTTSSRPFGEKQSPIESTKPENSKWPFITAAIVLLLAAGTWLKMKTSRWRS